MAENCLTPAGQVKALQLIFEHASFRRPMNSHLTQVELNLITRPWIMLNADVATRATVQAAINATVWPGNKPVFCSFTPTKSNSFYCAVRPKGANHWIGAVQQPKAHRVLCMLFRGAAPNIDDQCSHRLGSGQVIGIERDINPNNLCWESDPENKSRGFCQLHFIAVYNNIVNAQNVPVPITPQQCSAQAETTVLVACNRVHHQGQCYFLAHNVIINPAVSRH